ncbi:HARBI1 [Mytilus coruscus]|uniref:Putative nuclease HARBI1 n=1 Tax=Mytilus coruscus TaxID=42192 RepID=A0A6J8A1S7_MYTCO|nr:HARBI1 [Mytilus coruscus]
MAARLLYDVQQRYKPRIYREFLGAEPYTESEFQARYRFSKESIQILTNLLNDDLKRPTHRSHAIPVETQIKIALRYYASGSFMQVIGDTFWYNISTVSRIIQAVTGAICSHGADFLRWPDETSKPAIINGFYDIARFPCVIGAVDGTHIRIQAPSDNEYAFVNRKNFHSINVQGICDHKVGLFMHGGQKFTSVDEIIRVNENSPTLLPSGQGQHMTASFSEILMLGYTWTKITEDLMLMDCC